MKHFATQDELDRPVRVIASLDNPFQVFNTYIIFEQNEKILIVDQHAADERVNYEKLMKRLSISPILESADLLVPIEIPLNPNQIEIVKINKPQVENLGFKYILRGSKIHITAIPLIFNGSLTDEAFVELLNDIDSGDDGGLKTNKATEKQDRMIATMACHSSIRAGQKLDPEEMKQLITNLLECKLPYSCPHGRPIIWELTRYEIEKNFKRKI
jgi:DNA mismatch repair protein MutL